MEGQPPFSPTLSIPLGRARESLTAANSGVYSGRRVAVLVVQQSSRRKRHLRLGGDRRDAYPARVNGNQRLVHTDQIAAVHAPGRPSWPFHAAMVAALEDRFQRGTRREE
jgi:hypothetical protein